MPKTLVENLAKNLVNFPHDISKKNPPGPLSKGLNPLLTLFTWPNKLPSPPGGVRGGAGAPPRVAGGVRGGRGAAPIISFDLQSGLIIIIILP